MAKREAPNSMGCMRTPEGSVPCAARLSVELTQGTPSSASPPRAPSRFSQETHGWLLLQVGLRVLLDKEVTEYPGWSRVPGFQNLDAMHVFDYLLEVRPDLVPIED